MFQDAAEDSYDSCSEPEYQSLIRSNDYDDDDDDDDDDEVDNDDDEVNIRAACIFYDFSFSVVSCYTAV